MPYDFQTADAPMGSDDLPELLQCIPELEPEVAPERLEEPQSHTGLIIAAVVLVLLAAAALIYIKHRRKPATEPEESPEETALKSLQALRAVQPDIRECSLQLSMILRRYLTGATQDPALFETHEEFSSRLNALAAIPADCQYATRVLLEKLAEMKYAGMTGTQPERVQALIEETREAVIHIHEAKLKAMENSRIIERVKSAS